MKLLAWPESGGVHNEKRCFGIVWKWYAWWCELNNKSRFDWRKRGQTVVSDGFSYATFVVCMLTSLSIDWLLLSEVHALWNSHDKIINLEKGALYTTSRLGIDAVNAHLFFLVRLEPSSTVIIDCDFFKSTTVSLASISLEYASVLYFDLYQCCYYSKEYSASTSLIWQTVLRKRKARLHQTDKRHSCRLNV